MIGLIRTVERLLGDGEAGPRNLSKKIRVSCRGRFPKS